MQKGFLIALIAITGASLFAFHNFQTSKRHSKNLEQIPGYVVEAFSSWTAKHGRAYSSPVELNFRRAVFTRNYFKVLNSNAQNTFTSSLNKFADLTEEEFIAKYTGLKIPDSVKLDHSPAEAKLAAAPLAQTSFVDWREKGAVNPVKNQGQCGSCWAFSATSAIESAWFLGGNKLVSLSEQELVDCGGSTGNYGCNGGWMDWGFQYIIKAGGQELSTDYPYTARDGTCAFDVKKVAAKISKYVDVPQNDCATLIKTLDRQPVSVAVAVTSAFQLYTSGVFNSTTCGTGLNHGVTAVGYGADQGQNYYIVRNSWGSGWGEEGYIRMSRDVQTSTGICGICMVASAPAL